ncbi:MAG: hypothetical protein HYT80_00090 [Euryarchaeota archaeon]|nr:hypothetical protein [Euryarchaeota archaeon]
MGTMRAVSWQLALRPAWVALMVTAVALAASSGVAAAKPHDDSATGRGEEHRAAPAAHNDPTPPEHGPPAHAAASQPTSSAEGRGPPSAPPGRADPDVSAAVPEPTASSDAPAPRQPSPPATHQLATRGESSAARPAHAARVAAAEHAAPPPPPPATAFVSASGRLVIEAPPQTGATTAKAPVAFPLGKPVRLELVDDEQSLRPRVRKDSSTGLEWPLFFGFFLSGMRLVMIRGGGRQGDAHSGLPPSKKVPAVAAVKAGTPLEPDGDLPVKRLETFGIETKEELQAADPDALAFWLAVPTSQVAAWQSKATGRAEVVAPTVPASPSLSVDDLRRNGNGAGQSAHDDPARGLDGT